jgi:hypothetical protein
MRKIIDLVSEIQVSSVCVTTPSQQWSIEKLTEIGKKPRGRRLIKFKKGLLATF